MKKYVFALTGFVVLVLGGVVAAPHMIDWNKHKPKIQQAIEAATGYQVEFGGTIDFSVLPYPHVVVENLAIHVPQEGVNKPEDFVNLKKAEASLALMPLFKGEISISSINLVEPTITLEVARDGRQMWMTDTLKALSGAKNAATPDSTKPAAAPNTSKFALKKLEIENGTLNYIDLSKDKKTTLEKVNTTLSADSLSGPFKVKGDAVLNGQAIEADIQSARIDKTTKTVAVQANIKMPDAGAEMTYGGIIGTEGGIDLQGETKIATQNISSTVTALSGKASTLPPLAFTAQGLMTAKGEAAEVKTLKIVLGDVQANGSAGITNLKAQNGPMQITLDVTSDSHAKIESFMPVKSVKSVKAAAEKDLPKKGAVKSLLPETIALPMPMDMKANIKLAGLSYKDASFGDVKLGLDKKGGVFAITEAVGQMPGGGTLNGTSNLNFASTSQGNEKTSVIYSDPALTFQVKGNSTAPGKLLSAFLPDATLKSMQPLFKDPITLSLTGDVRPNKVAVSSGAFNIGKTALALGASSYTLDPLGKDNVVLSLSVQGVNLDHFMGTKEQPKPQDKVQTPPATPSKPAAQVLQESVKKMNLPVDLTVRADLKDVMLQGTSYAAMTLDGGLNGGELNLKTASLQDPQGNVMQISGTVKDLPKLSGVDVTLAGKTSDAISFLSSFKVDTSKLPKDFGPLDLRISLVGDKPENLAFSAHAEGLGGDGQADGMLVNAMSDKPAVDKLLLRVKHPNFEHLMQQFNPSYKSGVGIRKDMDVFANINLESDGYSLSGLNAVIGGMTMTGTITANTSGSKPDVKADLSADTVPLDILSGKDRTGKTSATAPKTTKGGAANTNSVRWSRDAINRAWMKAFNLDLKLNAKSVEYGNWVLNNTELSVTLKDGALSIDKMDAGVYGGQMNLTAGVKAGATDRDPISFNVKTGFKDVGLEPLVSSFSGAQIIKARGDVSLDLSAESSGLSPSALVSGLHGQGEINGNNIVFEGFDLAAMSRSLVSTTKVIDNITGLANASFSGGETSFTKINGPFTITEGVVNFDNLAMEGPAANITNKGQISLPRWVVDMNSTIDLASPEDAPNLNVRFQGPLDNPGNTFAGGAMESYIQGRVSDKLQKVLSDKLGKDQPELNDLLNSVLGGGKQATPPVKAVAPKAVTAPPATATTVPKTAAPLTVTPETAPAAVEPAAQATPEAVPEEAPAATPAVEEKAIKEPESSTPEDALKGVLEGIMQGQ